jgi:ABC-type amino acid transport substrate-binding protein
MHGSVTAAKELAPLGVLRAAINFGNPVLAQKDPTSGELRGVSVDLANELGTSAKVASRTNLPRSSASSADRCCHLMMLDLISSEAGSHQYNLPSPRELPKSRGDQA